jgi:hypothetical protein
LSGYGNISLLVRTGRNGGVADLPGVLRGLEASFSASLRREESLEADGLARSLLNDLDLGRAAARLAGPHIVLADGRTATLTEVALDHLVATSPRPICVPLERAVVRGVEPSNAGSSSDESRARRSHQLLVGRLREWAGNALRVKVVTETAGIHEGRLVRATTDHIALTHAGYEVILPLGVLCEVHALERVQPLSFEVNG